MANTIRKLEEDNYNLEQNRETLYRAVGVRTAECHNLNLALSEARDCGTRRETGYNQKLKGDESQINNDKESMRGVMGMNQDLAKN